MDWVIIALLLIILAYLVILHRRLDGVENKLRVMNSKFSTRQTGVAHRRSTESIPHVDARARTVRRDTHDLPVTGRMSDGLHRRKRDASIIRDN